MSNGRGIFRIPTLVKLKQFLMAIVGRQYDDHGDGEDDDDHVEEDDDDDCKCCSPSRASNRME